MNHGQAELSSNTVLADVAKAMVCHLEIDITSIDIVQVFLDSTCLPEIYDSVKSSVQLIVLAIPFPDSILNIFLIIISVPVCIPLFQNSPSVHRPSQATSCYSV